MSRLSPNQVDKITNRIHTDYMQTVAKGSNNPNLQNILFVPNVEDKLEKHL
jgi:DNA polymerase I-like protein with 3'-5' exonuclease and polymerase domains